METSQSGTVADLPFDTQFDVFAGGDFEEPNLTDEEFLAAACGAIAGIIDKYDAKPEEGGLTNEEIFARLQGVFDVTSDRYSADEARRVEAGMRLMDAIGHAACGNHEILFGAKRNGLLPESVVEQHQHAGHDHDRHAREENIGEVAGKDTKKKKKKKRRQRN